MYVFRSPGMNAAYGACSRVNCWAVESQEVLPSRVPKSPCHVALSQLHVGIPIAPQPRLFEILSVFSVLAILTGCMIDLTVVLTSFSLVSNNVEHPSLCSLAV